MLNAVGQVCGAARGCAEVPLVKLEFLTEETVYRGKHSSPTAEYPPAVDGSANGKLCGVAALNHKRRRLGGDQQESLADELGMYSGRLPVPPVCTPAADHHQRGARIGHAIHLWRYDHSTKRLFISQSVLFLREQEDVEYGQPLPASTTAWRLTSGSRVCCMSTVTVGTVECAITVVGFMFVFATLCTDAKAAFRRLESCLSKIPFEDKIKKQSHQGIPHPSYSVFTVFLHHHLLSLLCQKRLSKIK
nr:uncharacterized protein LOC126517480 isoform X4 [Dermacentor andersoni]